MLSLRPLLYMIMLALLIISFGCEPPSRDTPRDTPAQQWEHWINLLEFDMKSVAQSADWISKHDDEILIPPKIDFMERHPVLELPFVQYGISITTDHNGKLRVGKQKGFGGRWPPAKTPLKVGDKLSDTFSFKDSFEWTGQASDFEAFIKNRTYRFVFEGKKTYNFTDAGSTVTYTSPKGATIHYNADKIIIQSGHLHLAFNLLYFSPLRRYFSVG